MTLTPATSATSTPTPVPLIPPYVPQLSGQYGYPPPLQPVPANLPPLPFLPLSPPRSPPSSTNTMARRQHPPQQLLLRHRLRPELLYPTRPNTNPRLRWDPHLHSLFLQAVDLLGEDKATPAKILKVMNSQGVRGITRFQISSHLQQHRVQTRPKRPAKNWTFYYPASPSGSLPDSPDSGGSHPLVASNGFECASSRSSSPPASPFTFPQTFAQQLEYLQEVVLPPQTTPLQERSVVSSPSIPRPGSLGNQNPIEQEEEDDSSKVTITPIVPNSDGYFAMDFPSNMIREQFERLIMEEYY